MAGRIPREFIDDLLVRVDIVDLIDSHVPLKKTGSNYVACCPFHSEKSPSFSVNRKKQFFYCFGCGVGGNAIHFLMDYSHLEFVEAIEELATFVGVDVPREQGNYAGSSKPDNLKEIYTVLEDTAKFYAHQLKSNPEAKTAVNYLKERGLTGVIARDFMLGYAPNTWNVLSKKFDKKTLLDAGLLIEKEQGKVYDRFRGRVMFPIRDKRSRVIGFGARVLDDSLPKYLNSPETVVFSKGNEVYGLYEMLQKQTKPERILIVEGYMDVIALAQFGLHYAVATLGTATSKTHLDILFRFSSELVLCFDGDDAGRKAAWRAVETAMPTLRDGRHIKIMLLPQGEDPDSLIRQLGLEKFTDLTIKSKSLSDFFFEQITSGIDLTTSEGETSLITKAQEFISRIPNGVFRQKMEQRLKDLSNSPELVIPAKTTTLKTRQVKVKTNKEHLSPARVAIGLLVQNPHLAVTVVENMTEWEDLDFPGLELLKKLLQEITHYRPANTGALLEMYRGKAEEKILRTLASWDFLLPEFGIEVEFKDAVTKLVKQARDKKFENTTLLQKQAHHLWSEEEKQLLLNTLKQK